ncbi:sugar transferase [Sungkyunkwania multivorans]|uniref:Sugar transferase n=1 Tax=Sungkyunkwania multivorans TaxID=1173618 RepID=A0ABW3D5C2_9FLAO
MEELTRKSNIHFEISERKILLRIFDILSVVLGLVLVSNFFNFDYLSISPENWYWIIVLLLYLTIFANIFEWYDLQRSSRLDQILPNVVLATSITMLFYLLTPKLTPVLPENRLQILYFFLSITIPVILWRFAYVFFISKPRFYKRVLLIGSTYEVGVMYQAIKETTPSIHIAGYINTEIGNKDSIALKDVRQLNDKNLKALVKELGISELIIASNESDEMAKKLFDDLIDLLESGLPIREYTQVYEELTNRIPVQYIGKDFYRYFPFSRSNQNKLYLFYHRFMDILLSVIGLTITLAILPLIFLGNLVGNRGPLFYTQTRVGKYGAPFQIYKLRSMVVDAEKEGVQWAQQNDPRITAFGNFLRRSRLDELPQLINVLKGEMSIIGPRPERPEFVEALSKELPFYETRHVIKPGLTGWAQVSSDYGSSQEDSLHKLQYDLYYIKHRSFFLDASILVKTLSTVLFFRGR